MKCIIHDFKELSYNQKATLTIAAATLIIGGIIGAVGAGASWLGYLESKKERLKAEEAMNATAQLTEKNKQLAIRTVQAFVADDSSIKLESWNGLAFQNSLTNVLKAADVSDSEIAKMFRQTNILTKP